MDKLREALRPNDKAVASADRRERRGSARLSVFIEKVPLFKGASSAVLEDIGKALLPVRLQAGDYAVREGDVAKEMFFVISGTIEVVGKDGQVFATDGAGSFFGEMGLVYNTARTASVRAKTDCELACLSKEAFDAVKVKYPAIFDKVKQSADTRKKGLLSLFKNLSPFASGSGRRGRIGSFITSHEIEKEKDKARSRSKEKGRDSKDPQNSPLVPRESRAKDDFSVEFSSSSESLKDSSLLRSDGESKHIHFNPVITEPASEEGHRTSGEGTTLTDSEAASHEPSSDPVPRRSTPTPVPLNIVIDEPNPSPKKAASLELSPLALATSGDLDLQSSSHSTVFDDIDVTKLAGDKEKLEKERLEKEKQEKEKQAAQERLRRNTPNIRRLSLRVDHGVNNEIDYIVHDGEDEGEMTDARDIYTAVLAKVPLFQNTSPEGLKNIARLLIPVKLSAGEYAIRLGQQSREMFFVISGTIEISGQDGKVFATDGAGSFFGEMGLIFNTLRTASVCMKTDCELAVLNAEDFYSLMQTNPEIYAKVKELADSRKKGLIGVLKNLSPIGIISKGRSGASGGGWKQDHWSSKARLKEKWPEVPETAMSFLIDVESCKREFMNLELGQPGIDISNPDEMLLYDLERNFLFYADHIAKKEHISYYGEDDANGAVIVSVEGTDRKDDLQEFKVIVRTRQDDERILVEMQQGKDKLKSLFNMMPQLANIKFTKIEDPDFPKQLLKFEQQQLVRKFKFGVLYCKEGQVLEDDMFMNEHGSDDFNEFLDLLGDRITLKGWKRFRGGLDVSTDTTGKTSVYTQHSGMEVMFHVSTLLPFTPGDNQQVERKRHLGNDLIMVIFIEGDQRISPAVFRTQFNQVWMIVKKVGSNPTQYRVEIANKAGVPPYKPRLPDPPVFEKTEELKNLLLLKLINAERAALSGPEFRTKNIRTRGQCLKSLIEQVKSYKGKPRK